MDKKKYSGYGIGLIELVFIYCLMVVLVEIFGVDMSSSVHVHNKGKDILILGSSPTQGLGEHSLTPEKMYSVNFTDHRKNVA